MGNRGDRDQHDPAGSEPQYAEAQAPSARRGDDERAWRARVRRDWPVLYAARHLVSPLVKVALAAIGIGALLRTLLPRIDAFEAWMESWARERLSWVPDPLGWLVSWLRDRVGPIEVSDWVGPLLQQARWWVPILVAVAIGVAEVVRRRHTAGAPGGPPEGDAESADERDADQDDESGEQLDRGAHANAPHDVRGTGSR